MAVEVDVRDLLGQPGAARSVHVHRSVEGLRTELARVPEDQPIEGDLLLESVGLGVLVTGPLEGTMALVCARCLKPVESVFQVDVQELFAPGAVPGGDEYPLREEGSVDLEPMIRDAVMLAMPFAPLCRPDCLGLCPRCGGDRNLGECRCETEPDARWSALDSLALPEEMPELDRPGPAQPESTPRGDSNAHP